MPLRLAICHSSGYYAGMRLAELVATKRKERKWSQSQLAREAGVTPAVVNRIESGQRLGRADTIARITGALGIDSDTTQRLLRDEDVEPTAERPRRTTAEILRELEEVTPIMVPETLQPASAGAGTFADAEAWPYMPEAGERRHHFVAVRVIGSCMEPLLREGFRVIADKDASPKHGDIVVAVHDGEILVKRLEQRNGDWWLVAMKERPPIKVGDGTRIVGVVRAGGFKL